MRELQAQREEVPENLFTSKAKRYGLQVRAIMLQVGSICDSNVLMGIAIDCHRRPVSYAYK